MISCGCGNSLIIILSFQQKIRQKYGIYPCFPQKISVELSENGGEIRGYDRTNHTVWQVDMMFEGDTFAAHPRITNPASNNQDLNGYWWTNVGQKITVSGTGNLIMSPPPAPLPPPSLGFCASGTA